MHIFCNVYKFSYSSIFSFFFVQKMVYGLRLNSGVIGSISSDFERSKVLQIPSSVENHSSVHPFYSFFFLQKVVQSLLVHRLQYVSMFEPNPLVGRRLRATVRRYMNVRI